MRIRSWREVHGQSEMVGAAIRTIFAQPAKRSSSVAQFSPTSCPTPDRDLPVICYRRYVGQTANSFTSAGVDSIMVAIINHW
jgi:hypothetical protein